MASTKSPKKVAFVGFIVAAVFGWMSFRPTPTSADFQEVTGTVASTTAITTQGANEFTIRIWLTNQPDVAYKLAAKVSGQAVGEGALHQGSQVTMQALKSEIQKPFTGMLHNVAPTIEIASLATNGKSLSTWQDYQNYEAGQKKSFLWLSIATLVLSGFLLFVGKKQA